MKNALYIVIVLVIGHFLLRAIVTRHVHNFVGLTPAPYSGRKHCLTLCMYSIISMQTSL